MGLVLKPAGWTRNSECVLAEVPRRCENESLPRDQWHDRVSLVGGSRRGLRRDTRRLWWQRSSGA
eukprot:1500438-Pyramimonas_sp.AAC.1